MKMTATPQMSSGSHPASVMTHFDSLSQFHSREASGSFFLFQFLPWHSGPSGQKFRQTFLGKTLGIVKLSYTEHPGTSVHLGMLQSLLSTYYVLGIVLGFGVTADLYSSHACSCPEELENGYKALF